MALADTKRPAVAPDNLRGALWMLSSVVTASVMILSVRELSTMIDSSMAVFLRAALTLPGLAVIALHPGLRRRLRFSRPWLHVFRGVLVAVSTLMGFHAIAELPVATAAILFMTAPIFAVILSGPLQGERVGPRRWAAVGAGFLGAAIILRPGLSLPDPAMLAGLGSALLLALALSLSRTLAAVDGAVSTLFSSVAVTALVTLPVALPVWSLPADGWGWGVAAMVVASGAARALADIEAYHHGEASVVGPITYLRLVLLGIAGYVLHDEVLDAPTILGAAIIVGATLYIARREARLRRQARRAAGLAKVTE